jgi:site-specific DNA recombinase
LTRHCFAPHTLNWKKIGRARQGRRRPGYLPQGLTCCARCGYAHYGKTIRQLGAGRQMKDFIYYRCGGSDGYRFGGEAICNNKQVQGKFLETTVWHEVCELLTNPQKLEKDDPGLNQADAPFENVELSNRNVSNCNTHWSG